MKLRSTILFTLALGLVAVGCSDDDPELSTDSTIITGGTNAPATTTSTTEEGGATSETSPPTTLVGEAVAQFDVVARFPNENGEERYYVIPNGAYTDVDLENFVIDLIEADPELYGAEIFDDPAAAEAYQTEPSERTDEQLALLERHHFVTLVGRDSIVFVGPFSEFAGGAIGS